jgi:O-antigen ligase
MRNAAFRLYQIFMVSWFLHMTARVTPLGFLHVDLLLILAILGLIVMSNGEGQPAAPADRAGPQKILKILILYIVLSLPLIEWPGTVLKSGAENFIKAIVFFYFTVALVDTREKLAGFMKVFLFAQTFRVIEPVVLHVTTGYWGSVAHMDNWEFMNRLSGAPSDVVNPNGLAFVILMAFPFLHFLSGLSRFNKIMYISLAPVLVYALLLTGSRTGFVCFGIILTGIWLKSKRKALLAGIFVLGGVFAVAHLGKNFKDRYLSIIDHNTVNAGTTEGRIDKMINDWHVFMHRPVFGHGLGTSKEANGNYGNYGKIAHTLYLEIGQELGVIGLIIFIAFIRSIIRNFKDAKQAMRVSGSEDPFLLNMVNAMQVWIVMNLVFSFFGFGLSSYEWYLFAGLSTILKRFALQTASVAAVDVKTEDELAWARLGVRPLTF